MGWLFVLVLPLLLICFSRLLLLLVLPLRVQKSSSYSSYGSSIGRFCHRSSLDARYCNIKRSRHADKQAMHIFKGRSDQGSARSRKTHRFDSSRCCSLIQIMVKTQLWYFAWLNLGAGSRLCTTVGRRRLSMFHKRRFTFCKRSVYVSFYLIFLCACSPKAVLRECENVNTTSSTPQPEYFKQEAYPCLYCVSPIW